MRLALQLTELQRQQPDLFKSLFESPLPIGKTLPGIYREPGFTDVAEPTRDGDQETLGPLLLRLCAGLDEVLAPIITVLDHFPAYLDPYTTPEDMLDWLGGWIGLDLRGGTTEDERMPQRIQVARAAELLGHRGTSAAMKAEIDAAFGIDSAVVSEVLGEAPMLRVDVTVTGDVTVDRLRLDALVDEIKPAHLPHEVEVHTGTTDAPRVSDGETQRFRVQDPPGPGGAGGARNRPS
jgi:phage tail-like protein